MDSDTLKRWTRVAEKGELRVLLLPPSPTQGLPLRHLLRAHAGPLVEVQRFGYRQLRACLADLRMQSSFRASERLGGMSSLDKHSH